MLGCLAITVELKFVVKMQVTQGQSPADVSTLPVMQAPIGNCPTVYWLCKFGDVCLDGIANPRTNNQADRHGYSARKLRILLR